MPTAINMSVDPEAVPESVHTDGVCEVKLTGKPEVAAAPIVYWSPTFSVAGPFRV